MVAKFLDLNKSWFGKYCRKKKFTCMTFPCMIASRNRGTKTIAHTYFLSLDNGKLPTYLSLNLTLTLSSYLGQNVSLGEGQVGSFPGTEIDRKIVEIQTFCYHGNVTSHFPSLLSSQLRNSYIVGITVGVMSRSLTKT